MWELCMYGRVCVYVCVKCVCVYVFLIGIFTYTWIHKHTHKRTHTYIYIHSQTHTYTHTHMHTHTHNAHTHMVVVLSCFLSWITDVNMLIWLCCYLCWFSCPAALFIGNYAAMLSLIVGILLNLYYLNGSVTSIVFFTPILLLLSQVNVDLTETHQSVIMYVCVFWMFYNQCMRY